MKQCTQCKHFRPRDDFHKHSGHSDGLQDRCRECAKASNRGRKKSPVSIEKNKRYRRAWRYGLSVEELTALEIAQDGRCAICRTATTELCIDHDHETGKVRGLLCGPCNRGLGQFGDDVERMRSAVSYLSR